MRILVSCVPYDGGKSGISVYVREVVSALAAQGHGLTLLCGPDDISGLVSGISCQAGLRTVSAPRWTRRPVLSMLWHLFVLPFWIRRRRREFDGFAICAANRRVCAWYPLPTVATVHDLANFRIPGKYSRSRMFYLAHVLPFFAKRAQRLVAVSGATKADMVKFWHCRGEDVTVLYNGLVVSRPSLVVSSQSTDDTRLPTNDTRLPTNDTRLPTDDTRLPTNDYRLPTTDYRLTTILYISRIEHPGKNHVRLIEAYSRLPRALAEAHPLVIVGSDWKDADAVHEAAAKSPHADLVRFTGFADGEALERIWGETGFYVFPSLFEGFGLSLVEAMARGVPCACSGNGSLGEIAGDVALTFDPYDAGAISAALERLLAEPEDARRARVARGLEWIKRFSWSDHAKGIAALLDPARPASVASPPDTTLLFRIPVARITEAEALERLVAMARSKRKGAAVVATVNVDFVANAVSGWPFGGNDELWGYLKKADLVTADGFPIVTLSKLLRRPLPERVAGSDLVPMICRRFAEEGLSVYVLGGSREAIAEAFAKMEGEAAGGPQSRGGRGTGRATILAGHDDSFVDVDEDQSETIGRINAAHPDLLFVALGNPKQELWMGRNAAKLEVPVMIGVGGSFNFVSGRVKRAPKWVQRLCLEWVHRIIQEPGRLWKRYAYGLVKFSWLSLLHILGGYRR